MRAVQGKTGTNAPKQLPVKLIDVVTLLHNVLAGARVSTVGFEDANETLASLTRKLDAKEVWLDRRVLESALWSCNLMNESNKFWDGNGRDFDALVLSILGRARKFDRTYNYIKDDENGK